MEKQLEQIRHIAEILHAIEVLEYHDKNHLSGDNKTRCEVKMRYLAEIHDTCHEISSEQSEEKVARVLRDTVGSFDTDVRVSSGTAS